VARPIYEIANEIERSWPKVNYAARPYLDAMKSLNRITDNYMFDSGKSVVLYFLSNATTFRGEDARRLKKELKEIAGVK
jgi:hypothetical protein